MNLRLIRLVEKEDATFGVLLIDEIPRLVTLELPWVFNEKNVSCIPVGRYQISRFDSPKHGETFQVSNVHGRSEIEFHPGNFAKDTLGCILVAEKFSDKYGASVIDDSLEGFEKFLRYMNGIDEASLTVQAIYSTGATAL